MKVLDWVKVIDASPSLKVQYYDSEEACNPIWEGPLWNTPYWVAEMELADPKEFKEMCQPIEWIYWGEESENKYSLTIIVKDE